MTTKADFTEEEWATLIRAPMVAGAAISLADPGGPMEVFKETAAVVKVVTGFDDRCLGRGHATEFYLSSAQQGLEPGGVRLRRPG